MAKQDVARSVTMADELPNGWDVLFLEKVVAELTSGDWGEGREAEGLTAAHAIRGTDFNGASRGQLAATPIRYLRESSLERRRVAPGDLLIELSGGSKDQPTGRILLVSEALTAGPVTFSNFVQRLRVNSALVNPPFFAYYWKHLYRAGRTRTYEKRTTGIRNFKLADFLKNEQIAVPPRKEQQGIVSVLGATQRAQAATEKVIAATREFKRSLMRHLFTYGPVPSDQAGNVDLRDTNFGPVPAHWRVRPLGECGVIQSGVTKGRKLDKSTVLEVPYLRVANVQDGFLDLRDVKTITIKEDELERYTLQVGDVLFTEGGDIDKLGRGHIWHGEVDICVHQNHIFAVRPDLEQLSPEYLSYFVQSPYGKAYFLRVGHRTTHLASINRAKLAAFPVLIPSRGEQKDIVRLVTAVERKIEVEVHRQDGLAKLFDSLLSDLMSGRRRVIQPEVA